MGLDRGQTLIDRTEITRQDDTGKRLTSTVIEDDHTHTHTHSLNVNVPHRTKSKSGQRGKEEEEEEDGEVKR